MTKEKIDKVIEILEDLKQDKDFRKLRVDAQVFKITDEGNMALETFDNNFVSVVGTLKRIRNTLENRERAEEIRQRKIAIQRVDAQTKSVKKW
jgi:hypothetical protein|tara:strand:- start:222 stop:500 length:279 start_codon:yes stop_codon:yes gene_type:complete